MKLKDFLTLKVGSGIILSGNVYNPLINYDWSNTFQVANKMYSKNIGNSGQDLQLFSGQGFKSNGTNQTITIPVNATVLTEIKRVNGSVVLNTNQQIITNYVIGTGAAAVHTDYFLFTDVLTADEIALYSANPNQFFQNVQDGVIDNCVLNMPLHGVDKYQVDYSRYALSTSIYTSSGLYNSAPSNTRIAQVTQGLLFEAGKTYSINYTFTDNVNIGNFSLYIPPSSNNGVSVSINIARTSSNQDFIVRIPSTFTKLDGTASAYFWLTVNGTATSTTFQNISVKEISGVNEVINYTADCVTLAKQLPYGSQEANFFHTSSGVPIRTGLSPFFESTPYWNNYGNTGWVCSGENDWTIDFVGLFQTKALEQTHGTAYSTSNNRIALGVTPLGIPFARCGGNIINFSTLSKFDTLLNLVLVYKSTAKTFELYMNGIYATAHTNINFIGSVNPFHLGSLGINTYKVDAAVRLFKVHTKALTREDITKNFNEYTAKGLFANFLLDENGNYIKDESNNYIMT